MLLGIKFAYKYIYIYIAKKKKPGSPLKRKRLALQKFHHFLLADALFQKHDENLDCGFAAETRKRTSIGSLCINWVVPFSFAGTP